MIIPHQELPPDTLRAVIEEFITREGTDYGEQEFNLEQKVQQVMSQLDRADIYILYSELHESCTLISRSELQGHTGQ